MAERLAYIFLNGIYDESLPEEFVYEFGYNIKFMRGAPLIDDSLWPKWLGIEWKNIRQANFFIEIGSDRYIDAIDNKELEFKAKVLWFSLLLTGSFYLENVFYGIGYKENSKIGISLPSNWDESFIPGDDFCDTLSEDLMNKWKNIFEQLYPVYLDRKNFLRFKKGVWCFYKGCCESEIFFRLPYFVRSLEALILPDKGKTKKQFKSRVSQWWVANNQKDHFSEDAMTTLLEIYDLRCDFEHMHNSEINEVNKQLLRSYQCEEVARNAYYDILMNSDKLEMFMNDKTMKRFWANQ